MNQFWALRVLSGSCAFLAASAGAVLFYQSHNHWIRNDVDLDFTQPHHLVTHQMEVQTGKMGRLQEPQMSLVADSGRPIALAPKLGSEPQFVLFIKRGCPCSVDAQPIFNKLAESYKGKVQFLGVIDGDAVAAKDYAAQFSVAFPVLADPNCAAIHGFQATAGVYNALIAPDGKLIKMWPGYSAQLLAEMNRYLASAAHSKLKPFDPEYAPKVKTTGCAFAPDLSHV